MKGWGFHWLKCIKGKGNLSFGSVKELTDKFYGLKKSRKHYFVVIDSYIKDSAFTAVERDAKCNKV